MRVLMLALLFMASVALAQQPTDPPGLEPVPDGAPLSTLDDEGTLVPEVTIRRRGGAVIEEHRLNGKLYMVRVVPKRGRPYYLLDNDGDGVLETRFSDLADGIAIPAWVILSW